MINEGSARYITKVATPCMLSRLIRPLRAATKPVPISRKIGRVMASISSMGAFLPWCGGRSADEGADQSRLGLQQREILLKQGVMVDAGGVGADVEGAQQLAVGVEG